MEEVSLGISKFIPGAWARPCDTCKSTASLLYCPTHSLFLCIPCDSNIHVPPHAPPHTPHAPPHIPHAPPHGRVWLCDVCEQAPAIVTCKADAAALCAACDRDIHSANPLARRHERVPVVPFTAAAAADSVDEFRLVDDDVTFCSHDVTPSGWEFPNIHTKIEPDLPHVKGHVDFMFADTDHFLDFNRTGTDSVVPVQSMKTYEEAATQEIISQLSNKYVEIDFTNSKFNSVKHNLSFVPQTISQSISSSSMDVGVVPDGSSMSDISYPCMRPGVTKVDFTGSTNIPVSQGLDREARVMRYREKRKNRKFEKTIRYASRKAYAESRPRIKGRFAKRTETEPELMNQMFIKSSAFMADSAGYGIVPSF